MHTLETNYHMDLDSEIELDTVAIYNFYGEKQWSVRCDKT